jgi:hypothetical protein
MVPEFRWRLMQVCLASGNPLPPGVFPPKGAAKSHATSWTPRNSGRRFAFPGQLAFKADGSHGKPATPTLHCGNPHGRGRCAPLHCRAAQ